MGSRAARAPAAQQKGSTWGGSWPPLTCTASGDRVGNKPDPHLELTAGMATPRRVQQAVHPTPPLRRCNSQMRHNAAAAATAKAFLNSAAAATLYPAGANPLTSSAMSSQISAVGAGNSGPGTCALEVYRAYAATLTKTEAPEPSSMAENCALGHTPSRWAVLKSCRLVGLAQSAL